MLPEFCIFFYNKNQVTLKIETIYILTLLVIVQKCLHICSPSPTEPPAPFSHF